ncbi:MAG: ComF family protein [Bacteroides sp.]|nr:ComF family protein [Bacteroides sp.]
MSIWNDLWELFFPRYCVVCDTRLCKAEENLCFKCLSRLPRTHLHRRKDNELEKNFWGRFPIERASSFLYYSKGGDVRKLLYELKYYGNRQIGLTLGKCMAAEMQASGFFEGIDVLIPVPLHPKKRRSRGYNQSEVLAEGIASVTGIPVASDWLSRNEHTETQTHKSQYERWLNVEGAFVCNDPQRMAGKHILLIDDVLTTGATIVACADALKAVCDLRISVLTLAWAGES